MKLLSDCEIQLWKPLEIITNTSARMIMQARITPGNRQLIRGIWQLGSRQVEGVIVLSAG